MAALYNTSELVYTEYGVRARACESAVRCARTRRRREYVNVDARTGSSEPTEPTTERNKRKERSKYCQVFPRRGSVSCVVLSHTLGSTASAPTKTSRRRNETRGACLCSTLFLGFTFRRAFCRLDIDSFANTLRCTVGLF